ncbi:hypothetical protein KKH27_13830 [bacterium]|nr:hypothetical protein [bacterium]MBU1984296.1 hypothetical protein [bacterium]
MFRRALLILFVISSVFLLISCEGASSVRQGTWLKYKQTYLEDSRLKELSTRVRVTSCEYTEGIGDEILVRVNYSFENASPKALRVSWEDKFIEDQFGALHESFDGSNAEDVGPDQTLTGLYSRHRIPRSAIRDVGLDRLKWGRAVEGEPGLVYRVRLKPVVAQ